MNGTQTDHPRKDSDRTQPFSLDFIKPDDMPKGMAVFCLIIVLGKPPDPSVLSLPLPQDVRPTRSLWHLPSVSRTTPRPHHHPRKFFPQNGHFPQSGRLAQISSKFVCPCQQKTGQVVQRFDDDY